MRTTAFRNVQSYSVTLHPQNRVQVTCTNDGRTPAFDGWTTPEDIQNPINGWTEFPEGQATFDKLNVISSFEQKLLNTPVQIYLDKSPRFQPYLAWILPDTLPDRSEPRQADGVANPLRDPHLQSPSEPLGVIRPNRDGTFYQDGRLYRWHQIPSLSLPHVEHRLTCGNAGTPTTAALVRDRYSGNIRLEITIDENWDWRVDRLPLPSVGVHQSAIAESYFMSVYRESQLAPMQALMRCAYVYDLTWNTMPNDRAAEIASAASNIYSTVQLRYVWYLGTPRSGWMEVGRTGQETVLDNGKEFNEKLTDVPPEIAADIFEEHDEHELANALRLQSGLFKKVQLNS